MSVLWERQRRIFNADSNDFPDCMNNNTSLTNNDKLAEKRTDKMN